MSHKHTSCVHNISEQRVGRSIYIRYSILFSRATTIVSDRVGSYRIVSNRVGSCRIVSNRVKSCQIVSLRPGEVECARSFLLFLPLSCNSTSPTFNDAACLRWMSLESQLSTVSSLPRCTRRRFVKVNIFLRLSLQKFTIDVTYTLNSVRKNTENISHSNSYSPISRISDSYRYT